jgi:hypothetical protein
MSMRGFNGLDQVTTDLKQSWESYLADLGHVIGLIVELLDDAIEPRGDLHKHESAMPTKEHWYV